MYSITMVYKSRKNKKIRNFRRQTRHKTHAGMNNNIDSSLRGGGLVEFIGNSIGVDTDKSIEEYINEYSSKAEHIVDVLKSEQGKKLKEETRELLKESLDIAEPSIQKGTELLNDGVKKIGNTGLRIVGTALNGIPPVFALTELSNAATAASQTVKTVSDLTKVGSETVQNLEEQIEAGKSVWGRFQNLLDNISTSTQNGVSEMMYSSQQKIKDYGKDMLNTGMQDVSEKMPEIVDADSSLEKYQQESTMIGGRTSKSRSNFLSSNIDKFQIINQYNRTNRTNRTKRNGKLKIHKTQTRRYK